VIQVLKQRLGEGAVSAVGLVTSTGTLVCCGLPILLVSVGLGSAVTGLVGAAPWLVAWSRHKAWVFAASALLLAAGAWMLYRPGRTCSTDPDLGRLCGRLDRWNRRAYWVSVVIWGIGFFAAYLLLPLTQALARGSIQ